MNAIRGRKMLDAAVCVFELAVARVSFIDLCKEQLLTEAHGAVTLPITSRDCWTHCFLGL